MGVRILDPELVQQIAAGEVVEDPSSVVKELIENSIDAEASKIFIELDNGGKDLIRITDDGIGMSPRDAVVAIKRHATSKIKKMDDLFNITSLGFRGEALASISSVSEFELITKTDEDDEGLRIKLDGGKNETIDKVASTKGTTIVVKDLFFNTPARRKHLGMASTELNKVIDIITRYAISNPLIYFRVEHNGKTILNSPNTASLFNNLVDIYGKDVAKELLEVEHIEQDLSVRGYISKPSISRADKNNVSLFINHRFVRNKVINDAIFDAYHTLLHNHRYPLAVLKLNLNPEKLDVNIHPAKTKIKIEKEGELYEKIFDIIKKTLQENDLIPNTDLKLKSTSQMILNKPKDRYQNNYYKKREDVDASPEKKKYPKQAESELKEKESAYQANSQTTKEEVVPEKEDDSQDNISQSEESISETSTEQKDKKKTGFERKYSIEESRQMSLGDMDKKAEEAVFSKGDVDSLSVDQNKADTAENFKSKKFEDKTEVKDITGDSLRFKVLGQMYKTYILCETEEGLAIVDQHAAHERIIFEKLMKDYESKDSIKKQSLLSPVKLDLNPKDKSMLESKKDMISQLGFEFEDFGQGTYILRTVPVVIGKQQEKEILLDVLDDLISFQKSKSIDDVKKKILSTVSCRSAIKAGDSLTFERMNSILKELFACDFSSNCPHGRPTVIKITIPELEKRFKRRGF